MEDEKELSIHVKKVLGTLHKLSKGKADFSVSYSDISRISMLEKPMVSSCLRYLRENKYIDVVSGGGSATNIYNFLKKVPEDAIKIINENTLKKENVFVATTQKSTAKKKFKP